MVRPSSEWTCNLRLSGKGCLVVVAGESFLVTRIKVTETIICDIVQSPTGARAELYPVDVRTYFHTHQAIDLTERELRLILEAVQAAKREKSP